MPPKQNLFWPRDWLAIFFVYKETLGNVLKILCWEDTLMFKKSYHAVGQFHSNFLDSSDGSCFIPTPFCKSPGLNLAKLVQTPF